MKLVFDTSVWIEHLRHAVLSELLSAMRGRFSLRMDAVVAAELRAGCRTKRERRVIDALCAPHERADRLLCPGRADFERAAVALSRLRERGRTVSGRHGALPDALIATVAAREGALLVTANATDFQLLARQLPLNVETFEQFRNRLRDAPISS